MFYGSLWCICFINVFEYVCVISICGFSAGKIEQKNERKMETKKTN